MFLPMVHLSSFKKDADGQYWAAWRPTALREACVFLALLSVEEYGPPMTFGLQALPGKTFRPPAALIQWQDGLERCQDYTARMQWVYFHPHVRDFHALRVYSNGLDIHLVSGRGIWTPEDGISINARTGLDTVVRLVAASRPGDEVSDVLNDLEKRTRTGPYRLSAACLKRKR